MRARIHAFESVQSLDGDHELLLSPSHSHLVERPNLLRDQATVQKRPSPTAFEQTHRAERREHEMRALEKELAAADDHDAVRQRSSTLLDSSESRREEQHDHVDASLAAIRLAEDVSFIVASELQGQEEPNECAHASHRRQSTVVVATRLFSRRQEPMSKGRDIERWSTGSRRTLSLSR